MESRILLSDFTVTRSDDALDEFGNPVDGTLRSAILLSNQTPGSNRILFNVEGTTIVTGTLPPINESTTIDGTSEPGYAGTPVIAVQPDAQASGSGLTLAANDCTIIGLAIAGWDTGITVYGERDTVRGCYIGTDTAGQTALPNGTGIDVSGANATIGSADVLVPGNLISGNRGDGIVVEGSDADAAVIVGNKVGTNAAGTAALGNGGNGVLLKSGGGSTFGGSASPSGHLVSGNLISGNTVAGVAITGSNAKTNVVQGNLIGTDATGSSAVANGVGVLISGFASENTIGGTAAGAGNTIAFNTGNGVTVGADANDSSRLNSVLRNLVFANGGIGIDLGNDGATANTPGGPHSGPNDLQNTPVLAALQARAENTMIVPFSLNSAPNAQFRIEFFENVSGTPGMVFLGSTSVTTNGDGFATGSSDSLNGLVGGSTVTATATGPTGNTSELAAPVPVPLPRPAAPGPVQAVAGYDATFEPIVTLTWPADPGATSYRIFRGTASGEEDEAPYATQDASSSPRLIDTGVAPGTTYYYTVVAFGSTGSSDPSDEESVTFQHLAPPSPVQAKPSEVGAPAEVDLSWPAVPGARSYALFRGTAPGAESEAPFATSTSPQFADAHVTPATTYYYRLESVGAVESSAQSTEVSAAVPAVPASATWNVSKGSGSGPASAIGASTGSVGNPAYTLSLSGITGVIPIDSFSWSVTSSTTLTGNGAGKAAAQNLMLTAPTSGASPQLFFDASSGKNLASGVLTAFDTAGNAYARWSLNSIIVASYGNDDGTDRFSLNFARLVETHVGTNPVTAEPLTNSAGWDFKSNKPTASASPAASFDPATPPQTSLTLGDGTSLIVSTFTFGGASRSPTRSGAGAGTGKPMFNGLEVTAALGNGSPQFLSALLTGHRAASAVLTTRDAQGKVLASWSLTGLIVAGDEISGASGGVPTDDYTFAYRTVKETTPANDNSGAKVSTTWNVLSSEGTGPASVAGTPAAAIAFPAYALTLPGVTGVIPIDSLFWSVAGTASVTATGGGGGTVKATKQDLSLTAPASGVSPLLFFDVLSGKPLPGALVTAYDASGNEYATWKLTDVRVAFYQDTNATDRFSLNFARLVETHVGTNPLTSKPFTSSEGWDFGSNKSTASATAGAAFDPATPPQTSLTLGDGTSAIVSSFTFGGPTLNASSAGGGAGAGKAEFGPLTVTAALGNGSSDLLSALLTGRRLSSVVLTTRDAQGKVLASWSLTGVVVSSAKLSGTSGSVPDEVYTFLYSTVAETVPATVEGGSPSSATWNVVSNRGSGPASASGVAPEVLAYPAYTLTLSGVTGVIPIDSLSWGMDRRASITSTGGGGGGAAKPTARDVSLAAPFTGASPRLLFDVASGAHLKSAVLTAYDANGHAYATWALSDVLVTSYMNKSGTDQFSLNFTRFTETYVGTDPLTSRPLTTTAGWDFKLAHALGVGTAAAAFDPAAPPTMSLTLGDGTNAVVRGFDFRGPNRVGSPATSSGNGGGAGKATFGALMVEAALGNGSADLLSILLTGRTLKTVVVVTRDAQGHLLASWTFTNVVMSEDAGSGNGAGTPSDFYTFRYTTATVTTPAGSD
jgi:type VI protein secretion system component Hcp